MSITAIILGFALLAWGAGRFVTGAAALARNLGVSPLLIGLTIVGFGTSAPEMLVSVMASLQGNPGLAIGNALGSNVANVGLILGVTALVSPLTVLSSTLRREYPVLLGVSFAVLALLNDGTLGRVDGLLMLGGLIGTLFWMVHIGRQGMAADPMEREFAAQIPEAMPTTKAITWFLMGLVILLIGSRMLVWGAVNIAVSFGISDLVIGLTIIALGTSLPELAASIASALKGEHDIAFGNIIGSNLYNLLAVLPWAGILHPGPVGSEILARDMPVVLGLTIAILVLGYGRQGKGRINRFEGLLLIAAFTGYQAVLFFAARDAMVY